MADVLQFPAASDGAGVGKQVVSHIMGVVEMGVGVHDVKRLEYAEATGHRECALF